MKSVPNANIRLCHILYNHVSGESPYCHQNQSQCQVFLVDNWEGCKSRESSFFWGRADTYTYLYVSTQRELTRSRMFLTTGPAKELINLLGFDSKNFIDILLILPCLEISTLTPHALPFKIKTLTMLHVSAYDMPVGGSKKKRNCPMELFACGRFSPARAGFLSRSREPWKVRGREKKQLSERKKKNQRIGIIGIIQGGWAQSGGVSALGESFRHPQRETVCTISHANSDPCSE